MAQNLPTNSWISVGGHTIHSNAAYIGTWEDVVTAAIAAGEPVWLRLRDAEGNHSVLVTQHTKVTSFLAFADQEELGVEISGSDREPRTNLAALIDKYIPRGSERWKVIEKLGLDKEVDELED